MGLGTLWGVKFVLQCVTSEQSPPCFVTGHTMPAPRFKVSAELGATGAAPGCSPSCLLCLSWALLPPGHSLSPLRSSGLQLEAVYPPSGEALLSSGAKPQHLGSSGCFLPFGEAAAHISGCLLAGCAPGMQTLPQHSVSTPANHRPQPELGQVQLPSLRVLQHPTNDRTF